MFIIFVWMCYIIGVIIKYLQTASFRNPIGIIICPDHVFFVFKNKSGDLLCHISTS